MDAPFKKLALLPAKDGRASDRDGSQPDHEDHDEG